MSKGEFLTIDDEVLHLYWLRTNWPRVIRRDPCVYCQRVQVGPGDEKTIEHILPQSEGGKNGWENLASACGSCNRKRGNMPLLKWLIVIGYRLQGHPLTKRQRREMGLWYPNDPARPRLETGTVATDGESAGASGETGPGSGLLGLHASDDCDSGASVCAGETGSGNTAVAL